MKFYLQTPFNSNAYKIVSATDQEIIDEFAEMSNTPHGYTNTHFYEDGNLYYWVYGSKNLYEENVTEEDAQAQLLEWAIYDAENRDEDRTYIFANIEDVKKEVQHWIEFHQDDLDCALEDGNKELITQYQSYIEQLKNLL